MLVKGLDNISEGLDNVSESWIVSVQQNLEQIKATLPLFNAACFQAGIEQVSWVGAVYMGAVMERLGRLYNQSFL